MERRVRFDMPEDEGEVDERREDEPPPKLKKHSLDSDEEEDEEEGEDDKNIMNDEEFEGMESGSVKYDGDIQITPFNLEEELETGHFDKAGNYIFQKDAEDAEDNWLKDIDWSKVKEREQLDAGTSSNGQETSSKKNIPGPIDDDDESSENKPEASVESIYKQMIELLLPGESIQKAIQRFGKNCPKVQRGNKRQVEQSKLDAKDPVKLKAKEDLNKLSSLADDILRTGDMDIYERTYEQINLELDKLRKLNAPEVSVEDDMFGEGFET